MIKKILFVCVFVYGCISFGSPVYAHVLITDTTNRVGAILHVMPDDDPVAGQAGSLFFDLQTETLEDFKESISLTIIDAQGERNKIATVVQDTTISAEYVFPYQGAYDIALSLKIDETSYTFNYTQRISRGATNSSSNIKTTYQWAEMLLVASSCGLLVLAIVVINRRTRISAQSK